MPNTFLISDSHFGHGSTFEKFKNDDGSPLRPFTSIEEMNETMVERWNAVVSPSDRVIHGGDVVINKKYIALMERLNGIKTLVLGNHDIHHLPLLAPHFRDMTSMKIMSEIIVTHIPVHPDCIERFGTNVHGHLHGGRVMWKPSGSAKNTGKVAKIDPRYFNICVEHMNYTPIELSDLRARIKKQHEDAGYDAKAAWANGSGPAL